MEIMTKNGWRQLQPLTFVPAPTPVPSGQIPVPYKGKFPSEQLCKFFNSVQEKMKFFDDGTRMVYGGPDTLVSTSNSIPEHPISYPPKGFW